MSRLQDTNICVFAGHPLHLDPRIGWVDSVLCRYGRISAFDLSQNIETGDRFPFGELVVLFRHIGWTKTVLAVSWLVVAVLAELLPIVIWLSVRLVATIIWKLNGNSGEQFLKKAREFKVKSRLRPNRLFVFVSRFRAMLQFAVSARQLTRKQKFDIFYCHDFETLWAGIRAAEKYESIIYDAHEFYSYADLESRFWEIRFWLVLEATLTTRISYKYTVSPTLAESMQRRLGGQWGTVCNAIPLQDGGASVRMPTVRQARINFIFQGRFAPGRGLAEVAKAFLETSRSDVHLSIRCLEGAGFETFVESVRSQDPDGNRVRFLDPVSEEELVSSLYGFDVGVISYAPVGPNHMHCCPNKLSQYLAAGLGILTNDLKFVGGFVEKQQCGIRYVDHHSLLTALENRFDEYELVTMKTNSRNTFENEFNWERQSAFLIKVLDEKTT